MIRPQHDTQRVRRRRWVAPGSPLMVLTAATLLATAAVSANADITLRVSFDQSLLSSFESAGVRVMFTRQDGRTRSVHGLARPDGIVTVSIPTALRHRSVSVEITRTPDESWSWRDFQPDNQQMPHADLLCENYAGLPSNVMEYHHVVRVHPVGAANGRVVNPGGELLQTE